MRAKQFGSTDLYVTPITFGTWEMVGELFHKDVPEDDSIALVCEAFEHGINFFGTAPVYGLGHSECSTIVNDEHINEVAAEY
ncbi:MAG: aldo/keto reductase [Nitrospirae bacterium]|nr:aldo/keto reductase [Nitrospirota bacterium]